MSLAINALYKVNLMRYQSGVQVGATSLTIVSVALHLILTDVSQLALRI